MKEVTGGQIRLKLRRGSKVKLTIGKSSYLLDRAAFNDLCGECVSAVVRMTPRIPQDPQ